MFVFAFGVVVGGISVGIAVISVSRIGCDDSVTRVGFAANRVVVFATGVAGIGVVAACMNSDVLLSVTRLVPLAFGLLLFALELLLLVLVLLPLVSVHYWCWRRVCWCWWY